MCHYRLQLPNDGIEEKVEEIVDLARPPFSARPSKQERRFLSRTQASRTLLGLMVAGCLFAACGSSSPSVSASQKVCNDRTQLSNSVSTVASDVRSGNLSKAKDDLPAVSDALNSLSQSVQALTSQESQALSPQIDALKSTTTNLENSNSLSDLASGLSSIKTQAQSIGTQIGNTLNCS